MDTVVFGVILVHFGSFSMWKSMIFALRACYDLKTDWLKFSLDERTVYVLLGHQISREYDAPIQRRMSLKDRHSLISEKHPYF